MAWAEGRKTNLFPRILHLYIINNIFVSQIREKKKLECYLVCKASNRDVSRPYDSLNSSWVYVSYKERFVDKVIKTTPINIFESKFLSFLKHLGSEPE